MERTITIGKASDNTIRIDKPDISSHHVRITQKDRNLFLVEDLESTNFTFVDGNRIKKVTIGPDEELRLSKDTVINLKKIFQISDPATSSEEPITPNLSDYIDSFVKLEHVQDDIERKKEQLIKRHKRKTILTRLGIWLGIIVLVLPFRTLLGTAFTIVVMIASTIAAIVVIDVSAPGEIKALNEKLQRDYVCPHCEKLLTLSWRYYAETGKCPHCRKSFKK